MNHEQFRRARQRLKLSVAQAADMLGHSETHIRRLEAPPNVASSRRVNRTTEILIKCFLDGYRPKKWPVK